jgi:hypothetical protein
MKMRGVFRHSLYFLVYSVKFVRLPATDGEKVGACVVCSQWLEELSQGGVEAAVRGY